MSGTHEKRHILTVFLCCLFTCLTVIFFSPLEVLLCNIGEFLLPFRHVWWIQLLFAFACTAVLTALLSLLPAKAGKIGGALVLGIGAAAYVQALILNGAMVTFADGITDATAGTKALNLAVWVVIIAAVTAAAVLLGKKGKASDYFMRFAALALILMQTAGFVTAALTTDTGTPRPESRLTTAGEFELAPEKNVIVFVIDTCDGTIVRQTLEEYPEVYDILSGWTYYPNATSAYSRTYPAIPYLLTGAACRFDTPAAEWIEEAYAGSGFLKDLKNAGTDIRIFTTDTALIGSGAMTYLANSSGYGYDDLANLDIPGLLRNMMKVALYKSAPYALKPLAAYTSDGIARSSFRLRDAAGGEEETEDGEDYGDQAEGEEYLNLEPDIYSQLAWETPLSVGTGYGNAFRFYHLLGMHPSDRFWTEELEDDEAGAPAYKAFRGDIMLVEEYIGQMKALGLYDQATLIITADHGYSGAGGKSLDRPDAACPLLMVKYPGSDTGSPMRVSQAPVAHDDLFVTVGRALGTDESAYGSGRALDEIAEDEQRTRYHYYTALYSDKDGEVALREYAVEGDATELKNWKPTGNWWDVEYSFNKVSKKRFADWLKKNRGE